MGQFFSKQSSKSNDFDDIEPDTIFKSVGTPDSKLNALDPRSPTADIVRTPIQEILSTYVLNSNDGELRARKPKYGPLDVDRTSKSNEEDDCVVAESSSEFGFDFAEDDRGDRVEEKTAVRAEDSRVVGRSGTKFNEVVRRPKCSPCDRKGKDFGVGLLETNLDYVETDIDEAAKIKNRVDREFAKSRTSDPKRILRAKLVDAIDSRRRVATPSKGDDVLSDPRSPSLGVDRTPIQVFRILDVDPRSPTLEFVRTPIQVCSEINSGSTERGAAKESDRTEFENGPDEVEFESDPSEFFSHEEESGERDKIDDTESMPAVPDMPSHEQTKPRNKVSDSIYEDGVERKSGTPRQDKSSTSGMNDRTPLSDRNGNRTYSRSESANGRFKGIEAGKIVDANSFAVSKIPVYRDVKKSKNRPKHCIDQSENIPPESMTDERNRYRWDNVNKTLII